MVNLIFLLVYSLLQILLIGATFLLIEHIALIVALYSIAILTLFGIERMYLQGLADSTERGIVRL
jgi:hypothetical protein